MNNITTYDKEEITTETYHKYIKQGKKLIISSKAKNTTKAYSSDWRMFSEWCATEGVSSLPATPETVVAYLSYLFTQKKKPSTISRQKSTISQAHATAGYDSPTTAKMVIDTVKGIKRELGIMRNKKSPLLSEDLQLICDKKGDLRSLRDCALLLIGFSGAFRRSELISLDVEDVRFTREGLRVILRRSKTDQEGAGMEKGIAYGSNPDTCPVRTLQDWLEAAQIKSGPLFRQINKYGQVSKKRLASPHSVARIVKEYVQKIGLLEGQYSGHSLRAGFATEASGNGASLDDIMRQTGHRSVEMVREYIRKQNIFKNNASTKLGL
ncbi:site-specific integrase [Pelosinus sp. UFO1]|uniref:site-specific integrase n=1 Tax=Pelosinus sp. UFO1 TaxID=484770 RepID=UPI0004D0D94D|nr:site-specific integrase [Pelosinus sp. UFO1]AIF51708.1 integrase family protein [Pelosinus sp. UFO1]